jgi:hypothetical protein
VFFTFFFVVVVFLLFLKAGEGGSEPRETETIFNYKNLDTARAKTTSIFLVCCDTQPCVPPFSLFSPRKHAMAAAARRG